MRELVDSQAEQGDADPPLTPEAYFAVALEILGEAGAEGLRIQALCDRLGVTKGSFYHHFPSLQAFVQAFADHWENAFTAALESYRTIRDPYVRIELLVNNTAALNHEAEAALRAWGAGESVIAAAQDRVDVIGEQIALEAVSMFVTDPERAALAAYAGTSLAVGMQHWRRPIDRDRYVAVLADWLRLHVGLDVDVVVTPGGYRVRVRARR